ncbi:MAG: hypothetical protein JNL13_00965 [Chitinophagaceae bacterium]|nr:hypothetical protein [Chitinophagaceae bacterium]
MALAATGVTGTFLLIILLSAYGIYRDRLPYSLNKIFWIFCLFFMGLAPLLQYGSGSRPFPWLPDATAPLYLKTNLLILCCMLLFRAVYTRQRIRNADTVFPFPMPGGTISKRMFLTAGAFVFAVAVLAQYSLSGSLWYRNLADAAPRISDSSLQLLTDKILKGLVLCYSLLCIRLYRQKQTGGAYTALILAAAVLTNFPTAIPRYWLATFYAGTGISFFYPVFLKRRRLFDGLFISGLALLFPLLTLARLNKKALRYRLSHPRRFLDQLADSFCGQDFDAYASLQHTLQYVQSNGVLWGRQLMTTLLFFIPRSAWPGKSVGSGSLVNPPRPGSDFSNFSSPLFAEGFLDFHLIGALGISALCAWIWGRYDRYYWHSQPGGFLKMVYPAYLGMAFFTLRGDLLSSFAYTTGIAAAAWIFYRVLVAKGKKETL